MNTTIRLYANQITQLRKELDQLRNPWISVKDRLPEKGEVVLTRIQYIVKCKEECEETESLLVQKYEGQWGTDRLEQHRIDGHLFDCISKVTHWMPIPKV